MAEANSLKAAVLLSGNRGDWQNGRSAWPASGSLAHLQREEQEVIKRWATGRNFDMEEVSCIAMGDDACRYRIGKKPLEE
jgi:hypothetical protein